MSTEMITCPSCGNQMPADARFCPDCGHANASAPDAAASGSMFSTPMDPGMFDTEAGAATSQAAAPAGDTPQGGAPTVNIGASQPASPSPSPEAWQPGQYNTGPAPQAQSQPQYTPPPGSQPTQNFQPYGGQYQPPVQAYSNDPQPPINYQYQSQVGVAGLTQRDPTVALLLELLGYVWFLGIGHMYAGRVTRGLGLLIGYWAYWGIVALLFLSVVGIPVACIMALIHPVVPILSGLWIRGELEKEMSMGRMR